MDNYKEHGLQAIAEERAAVEYERQREEGRENNRVTVGEWDGEPITRQITVNEKLVTEEIW